MNGETLLMECLNSDLSLQTIEECIKNNTLFSQKYNKEKLLPELDRVKEISINCNFNNEIKSIPKNVIDLSINSKIFNKSIKYLEDTNLEKLTITSNYTLEIKEFPKKLKYLNMQIPQIKNYTFIVPEHIHKIIFWKNYKEYEKVNINNFSKILVKSNKTEIVIQSNKYFHPKYIIKNYIEKHVNNTTHVFFDITNKDWDIKNMVNLSVSNINNNFIFDKNIKKIAIMRYNNKFKNNKILCNLHQKLTDLIIYTDDFLKKYNGNFTKYLPPLLNIHLKCKYLLNLNNLQNKVISLQACNTTQIKKIPNSLKRLNINLLKTNINKIPKKNFL